MYAQDNEFKNKFVESLANDIRRVYVSKPLATQMADYIIEKNVKGGYAADLNRDEFAFEITRDLRKISNDLHISILPAPANYIGDSLEHTKKSDALSERRKRRLYRGGKRGKRATVLSQYYERTQEDMFTYGDIKILPGQVGYVEIQDFESTSYYKKNNKRRISMASVFEYLADANSIIIDLRSNRGGLVRLAAKFCSYFSPMPHNYYISEENRISNATIDTLFRHNYYTDSLITNSVAGDKKIFVLISPHTISAGEWVAYKIKKYRPATVLVGENTSGNVNGYSDQLICRYYAAVIPNGYSFDETNQNFSLQGSGVSPDIAVNSDSAVDVAYRLALAGKVPKTNLKVTYLHKKERLSKGFDLLANYSEYAGDYRKVRISDEGQLIMSYDLDGKVVLYPKEKDVFSCDGFKLVRFARQDGIVSAIEIIRTDGIMEVFRKCLDYDTKKGKKSD